MGKWLLFEASTRELSSLKQVCQRHQADTSRTIAPQPSHVIAVLAKQTAIRAVKRQLQAQGRKVWHVSRREIEIAANEYIAAIEPNSIAQSWETVRKAPELRTLTEQEERHHRRNGQ